MATTRTHTLGQSAFRLATVVLIAGAAFAGGCRGDRSSKPPRQFLPDLDDQPKMKAQTSNTFWPEFEGKGEKAPDWGRSARMPVRNTVPFGREAHTGPITGYTIEEGQAVIRTVDFAQRDSFLALDPVLNTGKRSDGSVVERIPVPVTLEMIELGRTKYEINCMICHGGTGMGDGMVGRRWAYPLPNFLDDTWQIGAVDADGNPNPLAYDGHLFDTIRNGKVAETSPNGYAMPPYAGRLSVEETWAIVAYLRTIQTSQRGTIDQLRRYDRGAADELLRNIGQPSNENPNGGEQ
ncbi:MAG: c-type cytochrome [Phycisphaerales bacterium JB050]